MMKKAKQPLSLHDRLLTAVLLCWVLPVISFMILSGVLIGRSTERAARQELDSRARNAIEQLEMRLEAVFEASKGVSYDGVVRNSYRLFQRDGDRTSLYRTLTEYLNQNFTRDEQILAAFLSLWKEPDVQLYATSRADLGYSSLRDYREVIEPDILARMADADTGIMLLEYRGELYVARNLLDSHFQPYATIVLLCDRNVLFQSLTQVRQMSPVTLFLDSSLCLTEDAQFITAAEEEQKDGETVFTGEISGHTIRLTASLAPFHFWQDVPEIRTAALFIVLLGIPLLFVMILLFRRHVTKPMGVLTEASTRLQDGERGYQITEKADSSEFESLYEHFNTMSAELKNQFDRSILEQQALQQARMKALQLQINPHFLNNTLEIINWEARLANDDRVSAMIEALSIMMNGALGRDGRSRIPLREELSYADAYLYIIRERLGEKLTITKEIDESMLDAMVPRLILQPLAENAVEHDLTPRHGGTLSIRVFREGENAVLEVEHDGVISEADRSSIEAMLASDVEDTALSSQVGLRNVKQRLNLLYGRKGHLNLSQISPDRVLARVSFPIS